MAQQTSKSETKRGPGRPPGSKNKPKTASTRTGNPTKQEVLEEMQRRSDRDKRNLDVIWSITLFAMGVFLFITVVMNSTGSFGKAVHDVCNGLFGIMAYALPFLVLLLAALLLTGKLRHIGSGTAIFSLLIFINMCVLNSYRFIDPAELRYGFKDIASYYTTGVEGYMGGAIGMEIGSLLVKFFGKPGLLIIAIAVIVISVFMVANTPISRIFVKLGKKMEENRILKELEADERRRLSESQIKEALTGDPKVSASVPEPKKPFWKSVLSGITREESEEDIVSAPAAATTDIPEPFGSRTGVKAAPSRPEIEYTRIIDSPLKKSSDKDTLFGKLRDRFAGIDSETGEKVTKNNLDKPVPKSPTGRDGKKAVPKMVYDEDRNFDSDEVDYGWQGRKRRTAQTARTGLGLGDPDDVGHSGSFGLDGHSASRKASSSASKTAKAAVTAAGAAAAPGNGKKSAAAAKPALRKATATAMMPSSRPVSARQPKTTHMSCLPSACSKRGRAPNR